MVLSPEHPMVDKLVPASWPKKTPPLWKGLDLCARRNPKSAIAAYRKHISGKSDLERTELAKEKTGVFTGAYAINPVNDEKIPIWIADYVLASYGTGAIMAVPAHDDRDSQFARKFSLPINVVIERHDTKEFHWVRLKTAEGHLLGKRVFWDLIHRKNRQATSAP